MEHQIRNASPLKREDILSFLLAHKTEFEQKFTVERIGLFGSYARGEAFGESDIDIVVELRKPDLFHLIGIKQAVEEEFGCKVDVVRLRDKMNETLKHRIAQEAVYV